MTKSIKTKLITVQSVDEITVTVSDTLALSQPKIRLSLEDTQGANHVLGVYLNEDEALKVITALTSALLQINKVMKA